MANDALKNLVLGSSLGLLSSAVFAVDLEVQTSGLPDNAEAIITVVNEATGASVSLGLDATSKVRVKDLVDGAVTVKAAPVDYQGMTFTPTTPEAFMLLQQEYPDVYLRLKDYVVRHPTLATSIENNLFGHTVTYTTSAPPSTARLFAGLDQGILWNCDTTIPNSCGDFDNAGSKQDMTHLAYGSGYVWTSLLNTGGVDDSLLWKCDANTLNACATWDLWPKSQVTISGIAVGGGKVYVSWWESGAITGSTGIKSCDANASQPVCTDLITYEKNGDKVLDVVFSGNQLYFVGNYATTRGRLIACSAASGDCAEVVYSDLGGTTPTAIEDPRANIETLGGSSNGYFYAGAADGVDPSDPFNAWTATLIQLRPSDGAFNELDAGYVYCANPGCHDTPEMITSGNDRVYIFGAGSQRIGSFSNNVSACSFNLNGPLGNYIDSWCQERPEWGVSGEGDISAMAAGGGSLYIGYSGGKMLKCDESLPDQACASFNTAGDAINDMVYVTDPMQ